MYTSRNGILFIACREAIVEVPYQDGTHLSIGCGHNGPDVLPDDRVTPEEALELLRLDVASRERDVNRMVTRPLRQQQFDALVSLHYNRGNRDFPQVIAAVNSMDDQRVADLFPTLNTDSHGVYREGLRLRRLSELRMYTDGYYGPLVSIPWFTGNPHTTSRQEYVITDKVLS